MASSIILKVNFLITLIAMLIVGVIELLQKRKFFLMLKFVGIVLFFCIVGNQLITMVMNFALGFDLPKGLPATTYITMGVEEGVVSPGSDNGASGDIYRDNNWDYDAANQAAKEEIAFVMGRYIHDWRKGLNFFGRKQASQWNEPSFQGFSILWGRENGYEAPKWIQSLVEGKNSIFLLELFNLSQTLVLAGACFYLFLYHRERSLEELLFAIIFIGGFLFHTFWEAKSQYTMLYFLLLIPYMVKGYSLLLYYLSTILQKLKEKELVIEKRSLIKRALVTICVIIIIIPIAGRICRMKTFRYIFAPVSDEELLMQYEQQVDEIWNGE